MTARNFQTPIKLSLVFFLNITEKKKTQTSATSQYVQKNTKFGMEDIIHLMSSCIMNCFELQ